MVDAYVIGDGIVELAAALELAEVGLRVRIAPTTGIDAEALDQRGLRDASGELSAFLAHVAAPLSAGEATTEAAQPVQSLPAQVLLRSAQGQWLPQPLPAVLGIPAVPLAEQSISILGGGAATRAYLDRVKPVLTIGKTHELGKLVRARLGRRVLEVLVEPLARELVGVSADDAEVAMVAPGLNEALTRVGSLSGAVLSYSERGVARETLVRPAAGWAALRAALTQRLGLYDVEFAAERPSAVAAAEDETWVVTEPGASPFVARAIVAGARLVDAWVPLVEASPEGFAAVPAEAAAQPAAEPAEAAADQAVAVVDPAAALAVHEIRVYAQAPVVGVPEQAASGLPSLQTVALSGGELWSVRLEQCDAAAGAPAEAGLGGGVRAVLAGPSSQAPDDFEEATLAALTRQARALALEALGAAGVEVASDAVVARVAAAPYASAERRDADEARLLAWRADHPTMLPVGAAIHGDDVAAAIADARLSAVQLRRRLAGIAD